MKTLYSLAIQPSFSLEQAWTTLEALNIDILYGSEEEGQTFLYVCLTSPKNLPSFAWIETCVPYTLPSIDWEAQWAAHGHQFRDGYVNIDFDSVGRLATPLRLQPGSGFGDLSHPTTRLMLRLLTQYLQKQIVVDIGCGSGILTVAAASLGSPIVYGIDIDPEALKHSRQNADLNQLNTQCIFCDPFHFNWQSTSQLVLVLMNMIQSEQQTAWSSLPSLHVQKADYLTSGIRVEEREVYLALTTQWGWSLKEELEEIGWMAFYFTTDSSHPENFK